MHYVFSRKNFYTPIKGVVTVISLFLLAMIPIQGSAEKALFFQFVDENHKEVRFDYLNRKNGFSIDNEKAASIRTGKYINQFYEGEVKVEDIFLSAMYSEKVYYGVSSSQYIKHSHLVKNKEEIDQEIKHLYRHRKEELLQDLHLVLTKALASDKKMQESGFVFIIGDIDLLNLDEAALAFQEPYAKEELNDRALDYGYSKLNFFPSDFDPAPHYDSEEHICIPVVLKAIRDAKEQEIITLANSLNKKIEDLEVKNDFLTKKQSVRKKYEITVAMIAILFFAISHLLLHRKYFTKQPREESLATSKVMA